MECLKNIMILIRLQKVFYDYDEVINKRRTLIKILTLWLAIFDILLYERICNEGLIERVKEDDDGLIKGQAFKLDPLYQGIYSEWYLQKFQIEII